MMSSHEYSLHTFIVKNNCIWINDKWHFSISPGITFSWMQPWRLKSLTLALSHQCRWQLFTNRIVTLSHKDQKTQQFGRVVGPMHISSVRCSCYIVKRWPKCPACHCYIQPNGKLHTHFCGAGDCTFAQMERRHDIRWRGGNRLLLRSTFVVWFWS